MQKDLALALTTMYQEERNGPVRASWKEKERLHCARYRMDMRKTSYQQTLCVQAKPAPDPNNPPAKLPSSYRLIVYNDDTCFS